MQQIQYFNSAWGDIKNSPGWFGKLCLLALINFIPIFGQIVTLGYLYGWAREIAWGTHEPMPTRIFGNEDGKLYRRGWFILVLMFVAALVPSIVAGAGSAMQGVGIAGASAGSHVGAGAFVSGLGALVSLVGFVGAILLSILAWIGAMRISIYDRLSAGFQLGKIWKMFRHDTNGIMRIFGMYLLVGLIVCIVLSIVFFVFVLIVMLAGLASLAASGYSFSALQHMTDAQAGYVVVQALAGAGVVGFLGVVVVTFFAYVAELFIMLLTARAMGYWTMQFDVARWRGQDDPMPFETAPPVASAPPVNPAPVAPVAPAQPQQAASAVSTEPAPSDAASEIVTPVVPIEPVEEPPALNVVNEPDVATELPEEEQPAESD